MGAFFVGPYITWLARHMGVLQGTARMVMIEVVAPMTIETLHSMRMVHRVMTV